MELFSDVTFFVREQKYEEIFHAHKHVLASKSEYFRNLFSAGGPARTKATRDGRDDGIVFYVRHKLFDPDPDPDRVILCDTSAKAFRVVLGYFYTGDLDLFANTCAGIEGTRSTFDILDMCHLFGLHDLCAELTKYLLEWPDDYLLIDCITYLDIRRSRRLRNNNQDHHHQLSYHYPISGPVLPRDRSHFLWEPLFREMCWRYSERLLYSDYQKLRRANPSLHEEIRARSALDFGTHNLDARFR